MDLDDAGIRAGFVLHDRDASFSAAFDAVFQSAGIRVIHSAVQAPRMNSLIERWIGSCRRELLERTLIWNQRHLMIVLREYEDFYNTYRPHRALKQAAPFRPCHGVTDLDHLRVRRRDRAGGVLHEYHLGRPGTAVRTGMSVLAQPGEDFLQPVLRQLAGTSIRPLARTAQRPAALGRARQPFRFWMLIVLRTGRWPSVVT
jgi:hypothetical protein